MPSSTPYAASAAATPIASAKRPKKRANQAMNIALPMRLAALGGDNNIVDANESGKNDGTPPPHGGGSSSPAGGADTSSSNTTPLGKRSEE
ncbi:unnamed protein product, partial [Pylaiella littoralis]